MRYPALLTFLVAALVIGLLAWGRREVQVAAPSLLALTAPERVVADERVTVYGGVLVPEGRYELGTYSCQAGRCSRSLWLTLEGPQEVWRSLGSVSFARSGEPATVELRAFRADDPSGAVVAVWTRPVSVLPAPSEAE